MKRTALSWKTTLKHKLNADALGVRARIVSTSYQDYHQVSR